jgi:hypothetical protein
MGVMLRFVMGLGVVALASWNAAEAQGVSPTAGQAPPPPPATKIEAFKPAAGSVVTLAYDELGVVRGVSVDVREFREAAKTPVRGLVVDVTESQYRDERSFVDADEIPELLRGIDALLEVKTNPTQFENFEVRYTTKGELRLTAFNSGSDIKYAVDAGRTLKATRHIEAEDMRKLRTIFAAAQTKLASLQK